MHDNHPGHSAAPAREYLEGNGIAPTAWPPVSPDLNPLENILGLMKTYIQEYDGDSFQGRQGRKVEVGPIVLEA